MRIGLMVAATAALTLGGVASAQTVTRSHPVGMMFDGVRVPTNVFVRFSMTPIDKPFEAWRQGNLDPPAAAFVRLVRAATAADVVAGRPVVDLRFTGRASTPQVLQAIAGMAGGWQRAQIVGRFVVDGSHVFVFRSEREDGPATGGMAFDDVNGRWKGRILTSQEPARSLIVDALHNEGQSPSEFAPVPQTRTDFAVPLSADESVWLEFDGQIIDFEPLDDRQAPTSEATALYRQAVLALKGGDWAGFANLYTPDSKAKIEGWLANQGRDPRARETAAELWALDTRVVFEMDIGRLGAVLLYAQGDQTEKDQQAVKRVMVARARDGLMLSNYYKSYQFGLTLLRSPRWPKRAGELRALLERSKR